ncbi:MAG: toxin-antitoxin system HicB family antitoxin [Caldilineaceae bacterium SB0661_bin_32]|uniref:Toxin-antitoxin system HicB family antitoxin n=1 Tax=Caldilineaceae bacterium SB0661_bin_32 TaxID=2605255 RepID=A0A6B1D3C0_9CHLR|nr:toxin-antitoxin system HicB family antitoxin [Caldilineaceae bacterium SB0661_bin_32]
MANLQIRNIPDTLYERLRRHARENNSTMRAVALTAIERELARWEWQKRLAQRPETDLGVDAAALLKKERSRRDNEIG